MFGWRFFKKYLQDYKNNNFPFEKIDFYHRKEEESYRYFFYFLIFIIVLIIIIYCYFFYLRFFLKEKNLDNHDHNFIDFDNLENEEVIYVEKNRIDDPLKDERKIISYNDRPLYIEDYKENKISLNNEKKEAILKLKNNEKVIFSQREEFSMKDNRLYCHNEKEINFCDRLLLNDEDKEKINTYLRKEKEFRRFFLQLFLRINIYFSNLLNLKKEKKSFFFLFNFFKVDNFRQQRKKIQSLIASFWSQSQDIENISCEIRRKYKLNAVNINFFAMKDDIDWIISYQEDGYYKKNLFYINKEKFEKAMKTFENSHFYKIYEYFCTIEKIIIDFLFQGKVLIKNEDKDKFFEFNEEKEFQEKINDQNKKIFFFNEKEKFIDFNYSLNN